MVKYIKTLNFYLGMLCTEIWSCNLEVGFANIKLRELNMIKGLKEGWKYTKAKYKIKAWDILAILATIGMITLLAFLYW